MIKTYIIKYTQVNDIAADIKYRQVIKITISEDKL